jgi:lysine-specific demethylase/histidyl-hydroxylase NO66
VHGQVVERLVGDLDVFRNKYWRQRPYLHSTDDPAFVTNLFTLQDADEILTSSTTRPPYVELKRGGYRVREGTYVRRGGTIGVPVPDAIDVNAVALEFARGASILLQNVHDYHPANIRLCADFAETFSAATKSVGFITPPYSEGHGPHYDAFEGFIVQTHGTKTWYLYERVKPLPTRPQGLRAEDLGEQIMSVTLRPGDCLYVPWAFPHHATAGDEISCHLTVTVIQPSWSQVLTELMKSAIPREAWDRVPRLAQGQKEALAAELGDLIDSLAIRSLAVDTRRLARDTVPRITGGRPVHAGFVAQAVKRASLAMDSRITRDTKVLYTTADSDNGRLLLRIGHRTLEMPADSKLLLSRLDEAHEVPLSVIAGGLDERLVLAVVSEMAASGAIKIV